MKLFPRRICGLPFRRTAFHWLRKTASVATTTTTPDATPRQAPRRMMSSLKIKRMILFLPIQLVSRLDGINDFDANNSKISMIYIGLIVVRRLIFDIALIFIIESPADISLYWLLIYWARDDEGYFCFAVFVNAGWSFTLSLQDL